MMNLLRLPLLCTFVLDGTLVPQGNSKKSAKKLRVMSIPKTARWRSLDLPGRQLSSELNRTAPDIQRPRERKRHRKYKFLISGCGEAE
jgi:hypothetical protein